MAQIAIPIVIAGALYLMSNEKKDKKKEGFITDETEYAKTTDPTVLLKDDTTTWYNNIDKSNIQMNNQGIYSQYQDKYFINSKPKTSGKNEFESLTGNMMSMNDIKHNNMTIFYNKKSYGDSVEQGTVSTLDNYTGAGSLAIDKTEVASLFRPEENINNVYGNQNQNDFYQSRINESARHANSKPWTEIQSRGGGNLGYNWAVSNRDLTMEKNVDQLRAANNPKMTYENNYRAPQYDPRQVQVNRENMGKVINKKPDTFKAYQGFEGMGAASGIDKPTNHSQQMLTNEQRATTNVEYYGVRGNNTESQGYISKGEEGVVHKQQLHNDHVLNMTNQNVYPASNQNYGKEGFVTYENNRDNDEGYFGAVRGIFMANVVDPIVKGLKHTKKTNAQMNPNPSGYITGGTVKHRVHNPNEHLSTTNREMDVEKIGMNHLNIDRAANSDGYLTMNPYLPGTQALHNEVYGNLHGLNQNKSYEAEYNQRPFEKVTVQDYQRSGNTNVFNNQVNYRDVNKENNMTYTPLSGHVNMVTPHVAFMGENTTFSNQYNNINDNYHSPDILNAFKSNPYVQPLNSVA
jgi:hypothetical protein